MILKTFEIQNICMEGFVKMEKIAILTDSSSSLYNIDHNFDNLFMIDIPVYLGDKIFTNFKKTKDEVFYSALKKTDIIPKTSQPSVGETLELYKHIKALGYSHIIYLPLSKELSGTYQNAYLAKEMIDDIEIEIIDTKTSASVLGSMALEAARLTRVGYPFIEIIASIYEMRKHTHFYVTVNNLTSLVKNGRLSNAQSFIANILKIKPVIKLTEEGKIVSIEKVRTYKAAIKSIVNNIAYEVKQDEGVIQILYTNNDSDLRFTEKIVKDRFPTNRIEVNTLPATIVAHLGLETIAIGYVNYKK